MLSLLSNLERVIANGNNKNKSHLAYQSLHDLSLYFIIDKNAFHEVRLSGLPIFIRGIISRVCTHQEIYVNNNTISEEER